MDSLLPEELVAGKGCVKKPIMLMLILHGKIAPTLLISIISSSTQGGDGEALYSNLSLSRGFQTGSKWGVGYFLFNRQSLDSSFPLVNVTPMEYDETLQSLWKICYCFSLKGTDTILYIWRNSCQQERPENNGYVFQTDSIS